MLLASQLYAADIAANAAPDTKAPAKSKDLSGELPRIPPMEPAAAQKSFATVPGFRIEQVAAEPLVHSPVAMTFDENGRLFVVEMCDYSEQDKEFLGKVRLLEDTDGDGRFDKSTIYVDHLSWPTAVIAYNQGIFVGASPDILYCKDVNGDGKADERRVVFSGFRRTNVQGLLNSFQWGLDNRIHGATSSSGASVTRPDDQKSSPIDLNGRDFSFDPRKLDLRPESGGGQHGMSFDDWGRKFTCSNSNHLMMVMYEDRYIARNPLYSAPGPRRDIASDGPAAEIYRTSPVESWRVVRTRLRVQGLAPGPIEKGGKASGYFSGATGVTAYRGNAFPAEIRNQVFVGDPCSNLLHRKVLKEAGVALVGQRIDDRCEVLSSSDTWFRPVQFANAPDGTLYIADTYREVIEHPHSLPPEIKQHVDLTSGRDRGRIYRLVPEGYAQPALAALGTATGPELVQALEHRNGWHRDTAARLLFERQDTSVVPALVELAHRSSMPEARVHALNSLSGLDRLTASTVLEALDDSHPRVREHAVRLAERMANDPKVATKLTGMTDDADLRVRYQLAFSLGELSGDGRNAALAKLARNNASNAEIQMAIFSSLSRGAGNVLTLLAQDGDYAKSDAGRATLGRLARQIGAQDDAEDRWRFEKALETLTDSSETVRQSLVRGLLEGRMQRLLSKQKAMPLSPQVVAVLGRLIQSSQSVALDESQPLPARIEAIHSLRLGDFSALRETFTALLDNRHPQDVQLAALEILGKFDNPDIGPLVADAWPQLSPRLRGAAADVLFSRVVWLVAVLDSIDSGQIALSEFEPARLKLLEVRSEPEIKSRYQKLVSHLPVSARQDVVDTYRSALKLSGEAARGKQHFGKICAACHRLEGVGQEIGPNLATFKNRGAEAILLNMLDPNREVNPQYVNYVAVLNDGRTLTGIIAAETATGITLKRAENATDTIQRSELEEIRSTRQSIMPEGLEKQLDPQAVADVIAYLLSVN